MRSLQTLLVAVLILASLTCAHQGPPPASPLAGSERSVFPVYMIGEVSTPGVALPKKLGGTRPQAGYHACAGVFVAPHLMATSTSVLPAPRGDVEFADASSTVILDGNRWLQPTDVPFFDRDRGLVIIRTDEAGVPMLLRLDAPSPDEPLSYLGYAFQPPNIPGSLAPSEWTSGRLRLDPAFSDPERKYLAIMPAREGLCGAAVLDAQGRLVGITDGAAGRDRVWVVPASVIVRALREVQ